MTVAALNGVTLHVNTADGLTAATARTWHLRLAKYLRAGTGALFVGTCTWTCDRCRNPVTADVTTNTARTRLFVIPRGHWCQPAGLTGRLRALLAGTGCAPWSVIPEPPTGLDTALLPA